MNKALKRGLAILTTIAAVCCSYCTIINAAQETNTNKNVSEVSQTDISEVTDDASAGEEGLKAKTPVAKLLLDININFQEKINMLSKEEKLFESLKEINSENVMKAYLYSLDVQECYQYTIFVQHRFLEMIQKDLANENTRKEFSELKGTIDYALKLIKENHDALKTKLDIKPLDDKAKVRLETALFKMVYEDVCSDIVFNTDSDEKKVTNLTLFREYITTLGKADMNSLYKEMSCYRGADGDTAKEAEILKSHVYSLYGFDGAVKDGDTEDDEKTAGNHITGEHKEQGEHKEGEYPKQGEHEEQGEYEEQGEHKEQGEHPEIKEPSDSVEAGEGVIKQVAGRTEEAFVVEADKTSRIGMLVPREEKYYEVYAKTEDGITESVEIRVSTENKQKTYSAVKGKYKVEDSEYNWQMKVPYKELLLEDTDGKITADISALDADSHIVGKAHASAAASGVYDINKNWIGSDFAKLNTNKSKEQVYYVNGTVYSDDCNAHNITKSTKSTGKYSHLSVSSLDGSRATIRVRSSGYALTGTWLMIYGRIELNNLNVIGSGGKDRTVGLVSAKNCEQTTASTKQSYLSAYNCSFSVANKWAVHGDRNSYLDVSNCTMSQTKGGVGSHGEINIRNTILNNSGSSYEGWAGIHLNVPVSQGGFRHSVNLENNQINGYQTGVEIAVSDFFHDQPAGERLTSLSLTITGMKNTLEDCTTGVKTSRQNVDIPMILQVKDTMSDIFNCTTGICVGYENDTVQISGGSIRGGNAGIENKGTFHMDGGDIYSNTTGIVNTGTASMAGGSIYGNSNNGSGAGVRNNRKFHISGGKIYNNASTYGGGIFNENGAKTTISGGYVTQNNARFGGGIFNQTDSDLSVTGGAISENTGITAGGGIYNENNAVTQITGGDIVRNAGASGAGIYQNGVLNLQGNAYVNSSNDIYLPAQKFVTVTGPLSSAQAIAVLTPSDLTLGRICAKTSYGGAKGSTIYQKFTLNAKPPYLFRPGDYQNGSGRAATDVVISQEYTISYNKNYDAEVRNVPGSHTKYWYEGTNMASQTPSLDGIIFKGWSEDSQAQSPSVQPGGSIAPAVNHNMTLYAVWESKIKVTYVGNRADGGLEKSEYVTKQECDKTNGYLVRKNAEFTKYKRTGYTFAGWAISKETTESGDVNYPEKNENRLSFEELRRIVVLQDKNQAGSKIPEIILYDVWDCVPQIKAEGIQEFYEGTEVTKEKLISNVKAFDKEDGDLTKNIRIVKIVYADGKLIKGIKTAGITDAWDNDMPGDYKLDTWFLSMDKEDSPVIHKITYAVSDAFGNTTNYEWTVKVKYNEFPVIKTEDRYFTLEEAQNGMITEEILLNAALNNGKLKVTDIEEDKMNPGSIKQRVVLQDFKQDEFKQFQESGYVTLSYSVRDSMGPEGEGKETICQFTVHVVKDGEIAAPKSAKRVRFINKEYYELNADVFADTLTDEEKKALNVNGGLNVDSKWYQDKEYKDLIHSLWTNTEPDEVWRFTRDDVKKVKKYINEHGIGNSIQTDGLAGFINEFGGLRTAK